MNSFIRLALRRATPFPRPFLHSSSLRFTNSFNYEKQRLPTSSRYSLPLAHPRWMATSQGHRDVHVEELKKLQKDPNVLIIDVREKKEIEETGILPGAINIPLGELPETLSKSPEEFKRLLGRSKPEKGTEIVFSCRSGKRSLAAVAKAKELGFANLVNFAGGWLEWEEHMKS